MPDKHTRLDSQFSIAGAFWTPEQTERIYNGILTSDEKTINFTSAPIYNRYLSVTDMRGLMKFSEGLVEGPLVLHGFTQEGICTLLDNVEIDHPGLTDYETGQSITATTYRVWACVIGMHLAGVAEKCVDSARYTYTGLNEWLPAATSEDWLEDCVVIKVPLVPKDVIALGVREGHFDLKIELHSELKNNENDNGRLSRSVVAVEVDAPLRECFSWYLDIGNRLENLFSVLTGTSVALDTMFVYSGKDNGCVVTKRKSYAKPFDILRCVRCTSSQLANAITIWLSESKTFRSVENVALGILRKGNLFVETEFLSLAQALEGFHRITAHTAAAGRAEFRQTRKKIVALLKDEKVDAALAERICTSMSHVNDPTLTSRLNDLCGRLSSSVLSRMNIHPENFIADVVNARNSYTHTGSLRKRAPLSGRELFLLNQKMRALLRGLLLRHLEIPEEQITELLVRESTRWR